MNVIIGVKMLNYEPTSNEGYAQVFIEDYTYVKEDDEIEGFPVDLFEANFSLKQDEILPEDPEELCIFFEELNLKWTPVTPNQLSTHAT
jgi:hypothetical protein